MYYYRFNDQTYSIDYVGDKWQLLLRGEDGHWTVIDEGDDDLELMGKHYEICNIENEVETA